MMIGGNIGGSVGIALVGDGVTDNATAVNTFRFSQKSPGIAGIPIAVTLTLASPGVVNRTNHGLRVGDAIVFTTTGALPTGLVAGTTYYVMYEGLLRSSFQVTNVDPWTVLANSATPGTAINFTGSQSGTQSISILNLDWQVYTLPPGSYHSTASQSLHGDQRRIRVLAYGTDSDNFTLTTYGPIGFGNGGYSWANSAACAPIQSVSAGSGTITLVNLADVPRFWVGGWISVCALDIQNQFGFRTSFPPNAHYNEFVQVQDINTGTGVITLGIPSGYRTFLRNSYLSSYPTFIPTIQGSGTEISIGAAAAIPMSTDWDMEMELYGLHSTSTFQLGGCARYIKVVDCDFDAQGMIPSMCKTAIYENCSWGGNVTPGSGFHEIDKLIEYLHYKNCTFDNLLCQSTSVDRLIVEGGVIQVMAGTARNTHIKGADIQQLQVGPLAFGASETLLIENSRIGSVIETPRLDSQNGQASEFGNLINNFTFSGGTLRQPMVSTSANFWAVPGRKMYVNDMFGSFANMGSPFTVLNVYQTSTSTATVTVSIANPGVITWTAHGLAAGTVVSFTTTGALPTGLLPFTPYYVLAAGLTTNTFELGLTAGGAAIVTTGSQSGVHTAINTPTFNIDTTLSALPVGSSTNAPVTVSIANPAVVTWTAHGLAANTLICFKTTGALPTGINTTTLYFVLAAGLTANTFEFSTGFAGSPVVATGSQSGVHTCISTPLKFQPQSCPRVTMIGCTGCAAVADMSNGPANLPLFSYTNRQYVGKIDVGTSFLQPPKVYGTLVSMQINVLRADTGASPTLTATITAKAFNASLVESDLSQVIDLKVAGLRTITPTTATGGTTNDVIAAFANWICGNITVQYSAGQASDANLAQTPIFQLIIQTDQGAYTDPTVITFGGFTESHSGPISDTTFPSDGLAVT